MATVAPVSELLRLPVRRMLRSDFVRHSALVFGASMTGNVLNYAFNFALSRRLGVEGFATLSSLVSFIMVFSIPASILTLIVVKYTATYHAAGDQLRVRRLSSVLLRWSSIIAVIALLLGALLRGDLASFLRIPSDAAIPLCIGILALSLITPSVRAILQGEQDFVRYSISTVLEVLLKVAIAVALVYNGFGVAGAMFGWILGTATALVYTIWAVFRKHGASSECPVRLSLDMRRVAQTSFLVGLASAFLIVLTFVDVLLVKHYFNAHQAGLYAAVNLTGKVVLFLAGFVPAVLLPKAVSNTARGQNGHRLLVQALAITTMISGGALAIFGLVPELAVRLLTGSDFVAAAPYVLQYDAAMCLLAIAGVLVNYRIGIHSFQFVWSLGAVVACEIGAITLFHESLWTIVHILIVGNAIAVLTCCVGLPAMNHGAAAETSAGA